MFKLTGRERNVCERERETPPGGAEVQVSWQQYGTLYSHNQEGGEDSPYLLSRYPNLRILLKQRGCCKSICKMFLQFHLFVRVNSWLTICIKFRQTFQTFLNEYRNQIGDKCNTSIPQYHIYPYINHILSHFRDKGEHQAQEWRSGKRTTSSSRRCTT